MEQVSKTIQQKVEERLGTIDGDKRVLTRFSICESCGDIVPETEGIYVNDGEKSTKLTPIRDDELKEEAVTENGKKYTVLKMEGVGNWVCGLNCLTAYEL